jgi:PKHD-type hydroxylase
MDIRPIYPINNKIDQTNYYFFAGNFNDTDLNNVDELQSRYQPQTATIVGGDEINPIRKSTIKWINYHQDSSWIYDKLMNLSLEANRELWDFNLHSIVDDIQYTEYYEGGGHYDWHVDIGPNSINHRKVSITVQLSDPSEYEGGEFEIWSGGEFRRLPKRKGDVILFPSFLLHRITPITKGIRKSLVLWVGGGAYK